MVQNRFPEGWDEERVRGVLKHYEEQSEVEALAEDEAGYDDRRESIIHVPVELIPAVRALIAKHKR